MTPTLLAYFTPPPPSVGSMQELTQFFTTHLPSTHLPSACLSYFHQLFPYTNIHFLSVCLSVCHWSWFVFSYFVMFRGSERGGVQDRYSVTPTINVNSFVNSTITQYFLSNIFSMYLTFLPPSNKKTPCFTSKQNNLHSDISNRWTLWNISPCLHPTKSSLSVRESHVSDFTYTFTCNTLFQAEFFTWIFHIWACSVVLYLFKIEVVKIKWR